MDQSDAPDIAERLFEELRLAVREETVPPEIVAAAKAVYSWRTIDAELAELAYDSSEDRELAGVRGQSGPRLLTFEAGESVIEVEVESSGRERRLTGQVVPAQAAHLELHRVDQDGALDLEVDDLGRFRADAVVPGRLRLLCRFAPDAGGGTLLTEWVLI